MSSPRCPLCPEDTTDRGAYQPPCRCGFPYANKMRGEIQPTKFFDSAFLGGASPKFNGGDFDSAAESHLTIPAETGPVSAVSLVMRKRADFVRGSCLLMVATP